MKRYRPSKLSPSRADSPIFEGVVSMQSMVTDDNPDVLRANIVTFHDGARNRWHHHGSDQLLIVTEGEGIVATDGEEVEVVAGDVIHIPSGERHWHGAKPGKTFAHISILTPGELVIHDE
jgi:quercetin dioxygenase-like cupin family protein